MTHVHAIIVVRHGRTAYNAQHRFQGQIDIELDETGRWQAQRTADALARLYVDGMPSVTDRIVVSSDLSRASQTAHAFADRFGLDVHLDERVRERSFGQWEGRILADLAKQYPQDYQSWAEFRGGELNYGAEPKAHVGARGVAALTDWAARGDEHTDLYVFSHGAWISQTLQTLTGMNLAQPDYAGLVSMRNAHWARLTPLELPGQPLRWRLADYDHGPAEADTPAWEHPFDD